VRVLDMGHALAGPFAATMLADFGADVLKIERPGRGDPMRLLGPRKGDVPLWWKAAARNKRSVTLDFTTPRGKEILLEFVAKADVLVENFRPDTLERHGLGWDVLSKHNPRLVMLRISGFGQTGPHSARPGFGRTAEAMSGAAQLTGFPDGPPVHVGYSLADTLAGLMGAWGILLALRGRDQTGEGDCIDIALYEPLFRLIDWQVTVHEQLGVVPVRAGNAFPDALQGVAAGVARSSDGVWLSYSAATDSVLERLIRLVLGDKASSDPRFADAEARRENTQSVQQSVEEWIASRTASEVEEGFAASDAVIGPVYDMDRIANDPGFRQRGNIIHVADADFGEIAMHGVIPKFLHRPGEVRWTGPELGSGTAEALAELGILGEEEIARLREAGVI
jgi:crotonobetainyl-CoA:carnitine CoA-transferase CaiB-like acyl-CoA transferase